MEYTRTGQRVDWTRTAVRIRGAEARNGATSRGRSASPKDDDKIALLSRITCGDRSLDYESGDPAVG